MTSPSLLTVRNLNVSYGRVKALHGVSIDVPAGSIVTVIGANGAGKTTLVNSIMGVLPATGDISLAGKEISRLPLEARVPQGLGLVPERRELFAAMTVEENLQLGAFLQPRAQREELLDNAFRKFPKLKERRSQAAGTLSGGERQMLAMGRALMSRPKVLMLDEPSLGLAPLIVRDVFQIVLQLKSAGVSILLIEQNARAALQVADKAYVMELGKITREGTPQELLADPKLVESYLGFGGAEY